MIKDRKQEVIVLKVWYSECDNEEITLVGVRRNSNLPEYDRPLYKIKFSPDNLDLIGLVYDLKTLMEKRYNRSKDEAIKFMRNAEFNL